MHTPIYVYINWAAYDELSDNVELTESLAMRQLEELLRLRQSGVRLDYYLMDAFWYARDGAYRTWRKPHWPDGPDAWLDACLSHDVLPGLWVAGNSTHSHDPVLAWQDSLTGDKRSLCLFRGGFLNHFLESLCLWYKRGVRMFKFDFMNLLAATPELERVMLPSEIRAQNTDALIAGLKQFRAQQPQAVLLAYNGFDENLYINHGMYSAQSNTSLPFRKTVDSRWLEVFDSLYCGDPRPADVPAMNFWRSKDIYSDHMVRVYEQNGIPLSRIDNSAFMIGTTGTCYYRKTAAWQGMLLLSLARGGCVNTYYGNLDLLTDEQAAWFARAQSLYWPLQMYGRIYSFGALPGESRPYGFAAEDLNGGIYAVVNPGQRIESIVVPCQGSMSARPLRLLFHDQGYVPQLTDCSISLGPEQMALIGVGTYAHHDHDLGVQKDIVIPASIEPLSAKFATAGSNAITATIVAPVMGYLRVIMRQSDFTWGCAKRTTGGAPPDGITLGQLLAITVTQEGRSVPVTINYDKAIWSGLSWAVGECAATQLTPGVPVTIRGSTQEEDVVLTGEVYHVVYT